MRTFSIRYQILFVSIVFLFSMITIPTTASAALYECGGFAVAPQNPDCTTIMRDRANALNREIGNYLLYLSNCDSGTWSASRCAPYRAQTPQLLQGTLEQLEWTQDKWKDKDGNSTADPIKAAIGFRGINSTDPRFGTVSNTNSTVAQQEAAAAEARDTLGCKKFMDWVGYRCFARLLSVLIGTALITMAAWLLAVAGLLFNLLIDYTIVTFGYLFTKELGDAVGIAWGVFRDIANIVIIGMFVFIAINMILGVKEFGDKKKVAQVLIIAVLLNFSLLFTKVIIDASNFIAIQFYTMAQLSGKVETADQATTFTKFSQKGISGQFIDFMGLSGLSDTYTALTGSSFGTEEKKYKDADGWMTLLHGLVSATLLFVAAATLLYGCLLLITRAVLLILIMLTSAIAFASWLIPHHFIEQGWTTWWKALLKAAFFAPILMAMLWATLLVAQAIKPAEGTLGALIANPTEKLDLNALFAYAIVVGLLLASFKAASTFSHTISGFAATQGVLATGARFAGAAGLTWAASYAQTAGLLGRSIVGNLGVRGAKNVRERTVKDAAAWKAANPAAYARGERYTPSMADRAKMRTGRWIGARSFDLTQVKPVRKALDAVGALTLGGEVGKGGIIGTRKRQAEAALKAARDMGYESESVLREKLGKKIDEEHAPQRRAIDQEEGAHKGSAGAEGKLAKEQELLRQERTRNQIDADRADAIEKREAREAAASAKAGQGRAAEEETERNIRAADQRIANAQSKADEAHVVEKPEEKAQWETLLQDEKSRLVDLKKDREAARTMQEEAAKEKKQALEEHENQIRGLDRSVEELDSAAEHIADQTTRNLTDIAEQSAAAKRSALDSEKQTRLDDAVDSVSDYAVGRKIAYTRPGTLFGLMGDLKEDPAANEVSKAVRTRIQREAVTRLVEAAKEVGVEGGFGGPAGPAGPAGAPGPAGPTA